MIRNRIYNYLLEVFGDEVFSFAENVFDLNVITDNIVREVSDFIDEKEYENYNRGYQDGQSEGYDRGYEDGIGVN